MFEQDEPTGEPSGGGGAIWKIFIGLVAVLMVTAILPAVQGITVTKNVSDAIAFITQYGGYTVFANGDLPASAIVGVSDTQTLSNKTFTGTTVFATANITQANITTANVTNLNMAGNVVPTSNNTRSLGSNVLKWLTGWFVNINAETVNATQVTAPTGNFSTLNAPTGRGATYVIVAAGANWTGQSDQILAVGSVNNDVQINNALITLAGYGGRQKLLLVGNFTCNNSINATSNVDVDVIGTINISTNTGANGLFFANVTNSIWNGFVVHRSGAPSSTSDYVHYVATLIYGGDNTLRLQNFKSYNDCTGTINLATGITILNGSPIIDNFYAQGGGNDTSNSNSQNAGLVVSSNASNSNDSSKPRITNGVVQGGYGYWANGYIEEETTSAFVQNLVGYGGRGSNACGIFADNGGTSTWFDVTGYGGDYAAYCDGVHFFGSNANTCYNLKGVPGRWQGGATHAAGIYLDQTSHPTLINPIGMFPVTSSKWTYSSANDGRFVPVFDMGAVDYKLYSMQVYVATGGNNATLNIGTNPGGSQIASGISLNITNTTPFFNFNNPTIYSGGYMYLSPTVAVADATFIVYYTTMYSLYDASPLIINTSGNATIVGGTFIGSDEISSGTIRILNQTNKNWTMTGSIIDPVDNTLTAVSSNGTITNVPIYNTQITGGLVAANVSSFAKGSMFSGSGTWSVANTTTSVVVTHNLKWTPQAGDIAIGLTNNSSAKAIWIDTYTSTNFTIHTDVDPGSANATGWWKAIR